MKTREIRVDSHVYTYILRAKIKLEEATHRPVGMAKALRFLLVMRYGEEV